MKTLSLDLRERIVASYDEGVETRQEVAQRHRVSLGMVKKLLAQRKKTGEIGARHRYCGRKPLFSAAHRSRLERLIAKQPDLTLEELREALKLSCSLAAIHYLLKAMNLTFKKNLARQRARARRRQGGS
jgi:transposase